MKGERIVRDRKVAIFFAPIAARLELFREMTKRTKDCSGQSERFRVFFNVTVTFRFPFLSKFRLNGIYGIFSDACLYFSLKILLCKRRHPGECFP